jgi:hypothetical protein
MTQLPLTSTRSAAIAAALAAVIRGGDGAAQCAWRPAKALAEKASRRVNSVFRMLPAQRN